MPIGKKDPLLPARENEANIKHYINIEGTKFLVSEHYSEKKDSKDKNDQTALLIKYLLRTMRKDEIVITRTLLVKFTLPISRRERETNQMNRTKKLKHFWPPTAQDKKTSFIVIYYRTYI